MASSTMAMGARDPPTKAIYESNVAYRESWKSQVDLIPPITIIFDVLIDSFSRRLIAGDNRGVLSVWTLPSVQQDVHDDEHVRVSADSLPLRHWKVADGNIYCLLLNENQLWIGGDHGVIVIDWTRLFQSSHFAKDHVIARLSAYPSPRTPPGPVNDLCVVGDFVFGAVSDEFGCYRFRSNGAVKACSLGGNWQSVCAVPGTNLLLGGGENGIVCVYDCAQDKVEGEINLNERHHSSGTPRSNSNRSSKWISSLVAGDTWWIVGGGVTSKSGRDTGFLISLHGPTQSVVAELELAVVPKQLCLDQFSLVLIGNDSVVRRYHPSSLEAQASNSSTTESAYALAVESDYMAVGGVGTGIDVYYQGEPVSRLSVPSL